MNGMVGADPQELERVAAELSKAATTVGTIQRSLTVRIHPAPWRGPAADRFRNQWDGEFRRSFAEATSFLESAGQHLRVQADEQRRVSGVRGDSPWGNSTSPDGGLYSIDDIAQIHDLLDKIKSVLEAKGLLGVIGGGINKAWGALGAILSLYDIFESNPYGTEGAFSRWETGADWLKFIGGFGVGAALGTTAATAGAAAPVMAPIIGGAVILYGVGEGIDQVLGFWNEGGGRELWRDGSQWARSQWSAMSGSIDRAWSSTIDSVGSQTSEIARGIDDAWDTAYDSVTSGVSSGWKRMTGWLH